MKFALFAVMLTACIDANPVPAPSLPARGVAYACYTHASCSVYDASARNEEHRLCLSTDPAADVLEPGDAAASSWQSEWRGACAALEGTIGGTEEGRLCASPDFLNPSTLDPAPYGCDVSCEPLFEAC